MVPTSCSGFDLFLQSNQDRSLCDRERRKIGTEVLDMVVLSPEQPTICELIAIIASNLAVGCWCDCCSRVVHAFIKARGGTTSNRQKSSCTVLESNLPHSSPRCETADILHRNKSRSAECHIASSLTRVSLETRHTRAPDYCARIAREHRAAPSTLGPSGLPFAGFAASPVK
jgi:hypothetical protein